jgi:hypothetical protein
LRTHSLPVVRLYELHDESYYVVRRADGRPLAVPVWMTHPEAAHATVVSRTAHLPLRVLLELARISVTALSSSVHNVREEDHDAAAPTGQTPTTTFRRRGSRRSGRVQLPSSVQEQLRQALRQWMQALANRIHEESENE